MNMRMESLASIFFIAIMILPVASSASDAKVVFSVYRFDGGNIRGPVRWDCPVFAAYSDKTVIWRDNGRASIDALRQARLEPNDSFVNELVASLSPYWDFTFKFSGATDYERRVIRSGEKKIEIYGNWNAVKANLESKDDPSLGSAAGVLPAEIVYALARIDKFSSDSYLPWRPDRIRLIMAPAGSALKNPIQWPSDWRFIFRKVSEQPDLLETEVDGKLLNAFISLAEFEGRPRAVVYMGRRWHATVVIDFPDRFDSSR